jgi:hypothetical protein
VEQRIIGGGAFTPAYRDAGPESHEISGYLKGLFGTGAGESGEVVGDSWLSEARKSNREALRRRTEEILRERKVGDISGLSPNLAIQILEFGQDESRAALIEIWARLLANALDPSRNNLRLSFIAIVKQMDPQDVILIRRIVHWGYRAVRDEAGVAASNEATISLLASELNLSEDAVIASLEHLEDLGVLANGSDIFYGKQHPSGESFSGRAIGTGRYLSETSWLAGEAPALDYSRTALAKADRHKAGLAAMGAENHFIAVLHKGAGLSRGQHGLPLTVRAEFHEAAIAL